MYAVHFRFLAFLGSDPQPDLQPLEAALLGFRTTSLPRPAPLLLKDVGPAPTLQQQLEAIGSVSHDTHQLPNVIGNQFLQASNDRYFPGGFLSSKKISGGRLPFMRRPRLLHFALEGDWLQVQRLMTGQLARSVPTQAAPQPVTTPASVSTTSTDSSQSVGGHQQPATKRPRLAVPELAVDVNQSSELTTFVSFSLSVIMDGCIFWIKHEREHDVFLMNGYESETSAFLKDDFVFVEVSGGKVTDCECPIFRLLAATPEDGAKSCLHCRFVHEHITPLLEDVQSADFQPTSRVGEKLAAAWQEHGVVCLRIGSDTGRVIKFCVCGSDGSLSLVHLSKDGFVRCLSGECSVRSGIARKKALQSLESSPNLCPHLHMFKAQKAIWEAFVSRGSNQTGGAGEELEQEEDMDQTSADADHFDRMTGLWNFGGLSSHRPSERECDKLKRYIFLYIFC